MKNYLRLLSAATFAAAVFATLQAANAQDADPSTTAFYRSDAGHSGYSPTTSPPILSVLWQNTVPDVKIAYSTPVASGGLLYFGAGPHVYALNTKDGSIKWQYPADGSAATGDFNSSPAVADGKLFIGSENNNLSVFDTSTGSLLWQTETSGTVEGSPVVDNGTVFFGCSDSRMYAIRESDQKPLWGGEFRCGGPVFTSPIISDNAICFPDANGNIFSVKENTGAVLWSYLPSSGINPGSPVYRNGLLYATSGTNVLVISSRTGALRSVIPLNATSIGAPTVTDSNIYVSTSDASVTCLSLHGNVVWRTELQDIVTLPMLVTNSYVYAISTRGVVYALDITSGKVVWDYALQNSIVQPGDTSQLTRDTLPQSRTDASCLAGDGSLYTITDDGTVTAFSGATPDHIAPQVLAVNPQAGSTIGGANLQFQIFVTDTGSGIDPASVSLKVDGASIPVKYDPAYSEVSLQNGSSDGQSTGGRIILPTMPDGQRTAVLKVADWRGNILTKTWSFTVDNTLDPPGSPAPAPLTPDPIQQRSNALPSDNSNTAAPTEPVTAGNGGTNASQPANGPGVSYPGGTPGGPPHFPIPAPGAGNGGASIAPPPPPI